MVAVDRLEEFTELLKIKAESQTNETSTLRNRKTAAQNVKDQDGDNEKEFSPTVFTFSKSFLSECTLINSTLVQLNDKLKKISQKSDQISFSFSPASNSTAAIEEALNICSMNISILNKKLQSEIGSKQNNPKSKGFFSSWISREAQQAGQQPHPILEHCKLVLTFLEGRVGRMTEELEAIKTRKKNRESILSGNSNGSMNGIKKQYTSTMPTSTSPSTNNSNNPVDGQIMQMLQVENSRMIEEMSRGLFETLSSTESQVLEISRLQATLQNHLTVQHDLTCRLFEDSVTTVEDTRKGNEYLRKSGKDGSLMRKFLVGLILGMSVLLLLLHHFNK